jgi:hypothetical protein
MSVRREAFHFLDSPIHASLGILERQDKPYLPDKSYAWKVACLPSVLLAMLSLLEQEGGVNRVGGA